MRYTKVRHYEECGQMFVDHPVIVQEKVDGSQFSFWKTEDGILHYRTKNVELTGSMNIDKQFQPAVNYIKSVSNLVPVGYVYRCETLAMPRHNHIKYDMVPKNNLVLFDIQEVDAGHFLGWDIVTTGAARMNIDIIPLLGSFDTVPSIDQLNQMVEKESYLGGSKIEGVVIKSAKKKFDKPKLFELKVKYVSPKYREIAGLPNRKKKQTLSVSDLVGKYKTMGIWMKAVQHLRDDGKLTNSVKDIGPLINELQRDFNEEMTEMLKNDLLTIYGPFITKGITCGFAEWYKKHLSGELDSIGEENETEK